MRVGTLVGLWRYPVKSIASEALTTAEVDRHGVAGDRRWAFIRPGLERSGFPWLTLRESASMREFVPRFTDPERPNTSLAVVRSPDGNDYEVTDPALAARLGDGVRVIKQDVGVFDSMPLSLISTRTLSEIGEMTGRSLERSVSGPTCSSSRLATRASQKTRGWGIPCVSARSACASIAAIRAA